MKKLAALITALPTLAIAHDGHNAVGLFHHSVDGLVLLTIVVIAGFAIKKLVKK
jgi:hypothetical protein